VIAFGLWNGDLRRPWRLISFAILPLPMVVWFLLTKGIAIYAHLVSDPGFGGLAGHLLVGTGFALLYGSQRWLVTLLLNVPDRLPLAHTFRQISTPTEALGFTLGLVLFAVPLFLGIRRGPNQPRDRFFLFILGAYALELVLWPYEDAPRFGAAAIPFLLPFFSRGLRSKAAQTAFLAVLAVNIPGNAWLSYKIVHSQEKESIQSLAELRQAAAWINSTDGTESRVAAGRDVPLTHLYEYLGRRMLANAGPGELRTSSDVNPASQGNLRADYIVTGSYSQLPNQRYQIRRRFGHWMVLVPN